MGSGKDIIDDGMDDEEEEEEEEIEVGNEEEQFASTTATSPPTPPTMATNHPPPPPLMPHHPRPHSAIPPPLNLVSATLDLGSLQDCSLQNGRDYGLATSNNNMAGVENFRREIKVS